MIARRVMSLLTLLGVLYIRSRPSFVFSNKAKLVAGSYRRVVRKNCEFCCLESLWGSYVQKHWTKTKTTIDNRSQLTLACCFRCAFDLGLLSRSNCRCRLGISVEEQRTCILWVVVVEPRPGCPDGQDWRVLGQIKLLVLHHPHTPHNASHSLQYLLSSFSVHHCHRSRPTIKGVVMARDQGFVILCRNRGIWRGWSRADCWRDLKVW